MQSDQTNPSLKHRLFRLGMAIAVFLFVIYGVAPFLVEAIAPFKQYADKVDETGIVPGALYYTDVPQSADAEVNNRNAIRFMVKKESGSSN